ncbi:hypothetical protein P12x_005105 [Tundrisphaera lichenicola]|uniref:hypothetical protein n=1 Tax=Tundrisphaera lichenicola TaxID=2029860 RepID=UPI003EC08CF0
MRIAAICLVAVVWLEMLGSSGEAEAQVVGFSPTIGNLPDGVGLGVTPVVSADRRYVRLSVGAGFQTVDGFQTLGVPGAVGGGNGGGLNSIGVVSGMNGPIGPNMPGGPMGYPGPSGSFGYGYEFDGPGPGYWPADEYGNWRPAPRRTKAARTKVTRSKKPAGEPVVASKKKP